MKRRKLAEWLLWLMCVNEVVVFCCWCWSSGPSPSAVDEENLVANKFQNAVQQQNTFTILNSIEERLRNLDNVYSMQLSQNLETKLDQYNRKLENLDSKIVRLESLVMLNLGKISENISTKNFKDDLTNTDTLRKLDSIYEGILHRLNYIERKVDTNSASIQVKVEAAFAHLEKMEKDSVKRDSDLETELSTTILGIKNLTTTYKNMEKKIQNITEDTLNVSKHTHSLLSKYNTENRKSMNKLHDNIIGNLQYIYNKTSEQIQISDDTNKLLKQMKVELKDDFNNYANKVADMNSDMWRSTDTTEDDLKNIALTVNSTKIELQNGVRSLMLQIGKISNKDNGLDTSTDYRDLENKLTKNFDKILTNQDIFLESCHRLQMDESQIESEISVLLNKLIDMLEKKLSTETKDIKNFEKNLKNHDVRIHRSMLQANQNIISLFEKTTMNTQIITNDIRKVSNDLNALFSFVQSTLNDGSPTTSVATTKVMMDKLNLIERSTSDTQYILYSQKPENVSHYQIYKEIQKLSKSVSTVIDTIRNYTRDSHIYQDNTLHLLDSIAKKNDQIILNSQPPITDPRKNDTIRESVEKVFGENPNKKSKKNCKQNVRNLIDIRGDMDCEEEANIPITTDSSNNKTRESIERGKSSNKKPKKDCKQNIRNLIDIRGDMDCEEATNIPIPDTSINKTRESVKKPKKNCKQNVRNLIDIRSDTDCIEDTNMETPQKNETKQAVEKIFGKNQNQKPKKDCKQNVRNLIDIRADTDCVEETPKSTTKKPKKKKMKYDIDIRSDFNINNEDYEDTTSTTVEGTTPTTERMITSTIIE